MFVTTQVEEVKNRDGETQENEFVLYARLEIEGASYRRQKYRILDKKIEKKQRKNS